MYTPQPTTRTTLTTSKPTTRTTSRTTVKPTTTRYDSPRRVWTAPTRRPGRKQPQTTTLNVPSYDEYYDDYSYKEYENYPLQDTTSPKQSSNSGYMDKNWKGYTLSINSSK